VAAGLALGTSVPPVVVQMAMALAAIACGGIWIGMVGALRHYRAVNETISSLLLNYIAIALLNHLVGGPWKDPSSLNKPSTYPLAEVNMLGKIGDSRVHYGLIYGLIACCVTYFLIQRTTFGFAARTAGGNANYGYSGILVAFIARHNPLAAAVVAILLGGILAAGGILQRVHQLPDATVLVFQGLVFLAVLYSESLYGRLAFFKEREKAIAPPSIVTV
jgi:simple sugar transport system permease protein